MWTCQLCYRSNQPASPMCERCFLRRGAYSVNEKDLSVLHATTWGNYLGILQNGFIIKKDATAGRSMGDVVYGYAYSGGPISGSLSHGIGVAREKGEKGFAVFPMKFNLAPGQIFFFDQPAWDAETERPGVDNHDATVTVAGRRIADVARDIRVAQVIQHYSPEGMAAWRQRWGNAPLPDLNNIKPDHIAEAAQKLGYRAFYMHGTNIITFFYPSDLRAGNAWILGEVPQQLTTEGGQMNPLVQGLELAANAFAAAQYAQFVHDRDSVVQAPFLAQLTNPAAGGAEGGGPPHGPEGGEQEIIVGPGWQDPPATENDPIAPPEGQVLATSSNVSSDGGHSGTHVMEGMGGIGGPGASPGTSRGRSNSRGSPGTRSRSNSR